MQLPAHGSARPGLLRSESAQHIAGGVPAASTPPFVTTHGFQPPHSPSGRSVAAGPGGPESALPTHKRKCSSRQRSALAQQLPAGASQSAPGNRARSESMVADDGKSPPCAERGHVPGTFQPRSAPKLQLPCTVHSVPPQRNSTFADAAPLPQVAVASQAVDQSMADTALKRSHSERIARRRHPSQLPSTEAAHASAAVSEPGDISMHDDPYSADNNTTWPPSCGAEWLLAAPGEQALGTADHVSLRSPCSACAVPGQQLLLTGILLAVMCGFGSAGPSSCAHGPPQLACRAGPVPAYASLHVVGLLPPWGSAAFTLTWPRSPSSWACLQAASGQVCTPRSIDTAMRSAGMGAMPRPNTSPARALLPFALPTIAERRPMLARTTSHEELRHTSGDEASEEAPAATGAGNCTAMSAPPAAQPHSMPASPRGMLDVSPFDLLRGTALGGAHSGNDDTGRPLSSPFEHFMRGHADAGLADIDAGTLLRGSCDAEAHDAAGLRSLHADEHTAPRTSAATRMPGSASEPASSPACKSLRGSERGQQHSYDDLCLRQSAHSMAHAAGASLPPRPKFGFARGGTQSATLPAHGSVAAADVKGESHDSLQRSAPLSSRPAHSQPLAGGAAAEAEATDALPQPLLTACSDDFNELDLPPRSASAIGNFRDASQRSLDDLDMLLKTQDDEMPPWPTQSVSPPQSLRRDSLSGPLLDLPPAAPAFTAPAVAQSLHEPQPMRRPVPVPSRMVPASPQHAPSCVADADSDFDGCDEYSQRHGGSSPPLSTGALGPRWLVRRSVDAGAGAGASALADADDSGSPRSSIAHTRALRSLRRGAAHGPVFCSGRSIAAEWLQVPAVPLAPGAACHDDASVPEAAAWVRRGAPGAWRAPGARSRSVVSRNMSRASLLFSPDVQRLGVASSLASEGSEWPVHQRDASGSATGAGAGSVRANPIHAAAGSWAGGDGSTALRKSSVSQGVAEKPVPEGHELLWEDSIQ